MAGQRELKINASCTPRTEAWRVRRGHRGGGKSPEGQGRSEPRGGRERAERVRKVSAAAAGRPGKREGGRQEGAAFWKVEPWGQHVLTHSPALNFPCFLGILILFSGKLPAP